MNKKVTIYVATHKKWNFPKDKIYVPIRVGAALNSDDFGYIRDDEGENISNKNKSFCELTATYWILKNSNADIVGLTHYRRYFYKKFKTSNLKNVLDEKDILTILNKYDIIVPNKTYIIKHNVEQSWKSTHIYKDYIECRKIVSQLYPDYLEAFDKVSNSKILYTCNMFISDKKIFDEYYNWLFDILFELEKIVDLSNYDDYNKRLYGFMSERLFNVWLCKHKDLKIYRAPIYNLGRRPRNQYFMIN